MLRTCWRCGVAAEAPEEGLPEGWSMGFGERGVEFHCLDCTRSNLRSIEAKLPDDWWE